MGQSATLYTITQIEFDILSKDPKSFNTSMTEDHATFEQNFEGLLFLLNKLCSTSEQPVIREIFYPSATIGREISPEDFDGLDDLSSFETDSISYLDAEKITSIRKILNKIDKHQLLNLYDSQELNANGVYPGVWHNDESPDQAFNKRHIEEGFDELVDLFERAVRNGSHVLVFVG